MSETKCQISEPGRVVIEIADALGVPIFPTEGIVARVRELVAEVERLRAQRQVDVATLDALSE